MTLYRSTLLAELKHIFISRSFVKKSINVSTDIKILYFDKL